MTQNCYDSPQFELSCGCPPPKERIDDNNLKTLEDVVKIYRKIHYDNLETYLNDLEGDIEKCVYGPFKKYKKHPHQRRLSNVEVLDLAVKRLKNKDSELKVSKNFPELYAVVKGIDVKGYGLLAIYDFAIRYGFSRGIIPEDVYLHAGTLEGAKAVIPEKQHLYAGNVIAIKDLPKPLRKLNGLHLENLLCIYKKELKRIMKKEGGQN